VCFHEFRTVVHCSKHRLNCRSLNALRLLALNACGISSWAEVQLLEPWLPSLEELYLSENSLTDLPRLHDEAARLAAIGAEVVMPPPPPSASSSSSSSSSCSSSSASAVSSTDTDVVKGFANLVLLDLTRCGLDEWSQVLSFSRLPKLESLILDGNPLSNIEPVQNNSDVYQLLHRISLSGTQ
jgi:Leucine-rich repeat (LRR) protein